MIKNRELALIPDSALGLVDPPATSPTPPAPRSPSARGTHAQRPTDHRSSTRSGRAGR